MEKPGHPSDSLESLQAENARLIALLESHGIAWRPSQSSVSVAREPEMSRISTGEKVALFRRLFRGRTDVYPVRWEGKTSGKAGYALACANEWRAGVCGQQPALLLRSSGRAFPRCNLSATNTGSTPLTWDRQAPLKKLKSGISRPLIQ